MFVLPMDDVDIYKKRDRLIVQHYHHFLEEEAKSISNLEDVLHHWRPIRIHTNKSDEKLVVIGYYDRKNKSKVSDRFVFFASGNLRLFPSELRSRSRSSVEILQHWSRSRMSNRSFVFRAEVNLDVPFSSSPSVGFSTERNAGRSSFPTPRTSRSSEKISRRSVTICSE